MTDMQKAFTFCPDKPCFDVVVHNVNIHVTYSLKRPAFSVHIFSKQPTGKILISQRNSAAVSTKCICRCKISSFISS
uniref:Uncharacterized protein n=1 Tax=Glossina austeni TaxID=7395 RepID=A0A1A9V9N3_GLOAU